MDLNSTCDQNSIYSLFESKDSNTVFDSNSKTKISKYFLKDFFYKEYGVKANKDVNFEMNSKDENGMYFMFCWEGKIAISINNQITELDEFQSAIISDTNLKGVSLKLKKDTTYRFCIIGFNQPLDEGNQSYIKFKEVFFNRINSENQLFIGTRYLKLIRYIDKLSKRVKQNAVSQLIIEGLIYQIIGLKIEHLIESANKAKTDEIYLTSSEYKRVKQLTEIIKKNPGFEYTIEYLCKESTLSPLKLQEGFKRLFRCTAMDYVRDMRLEKALFLIKSTDLSISEIVYSIGLTSRSYFSKIFKLKYKCSPRIFRKQSHKTISFN